MLLEASCLLEPCRFSWVLNQGLSRLLEAAGLHSPPSFAGMTRNRKPCLLEEKQYELLEQAMGDRKLGFRNVGEIQGFRLFKLLGLGLQSLYRPSSAIAAAAE